jgi:very-short-patch-repair endonuclease
MTGEWAESGQMRRFQPARERDRRAMSIAARQRRLVTLEQLLRCGFTPSGIQGRTRRGRLFRLYSGVYSLAPPPFDHRQRWLAAVLACGPEALLFGSPAAMLLGMARETAAKPQVCVPGDCGRRRKGIVVRRRRIAPCDRSSRAGIPCTGAARTLLDVAAISSPDELERMLITADSLRILNRRRLEELVDEHAGARGVRSLRVLLAADPARVRSQVEADLLRLSRARRLPEPLVNHRIEVGGVTLEVDFCWPALRIVAEVDGYAFHGGRGRANADCDRDQRLALAGWRVHRFTADQVRDHPEETIRRLAALLEAGRAGQIRPI